MDLSTRIAPAYREKEMEIRNEIARVLERGKVDFSLWVEKKDAEQLATPINQELVAAYFHRIKEISSVTGIPEPEDWFATLLRMPDVMTKTETQELSEEEWQTAYAAVKEALEHLVDFRKQEGAALEKKFREKISNIAMRSRRPSVWTMTRIVWSRNSFTTLRNWTSTKRNNASAII